MLFYENTLLIYQFLKFYAKFTHNISSYFASQQTNTDKALLGQPLAEVN